MDSEHILKILKYAWCQSCARRPGALQQPLARRRMPLLGPVKQELEESGLQTFALISLHQPA